MIQPMDFGDLTATAGTPLKQVFTARWFDRLKAAFRALAVVPVQNGNIVAQYTAGGVVLDTTRPIPNFFMMRSTSGISAKDGATGAWGSGTAKPYITKIVSGGPRDTLDSIAVSVSNQWRFSVPNDADFLAYEQGGDILVAGYDCG
jgi:hypothetical protein